MAIVAGKIIIKSDTADDSKIQNAQKVSGTGRNIKDLIEDLKNPKPVVKETKPAERSSGRSIKDILSELRAPENKFEEPKVEEPEVPKPVVTVPVMPVMDPTPKVDEPPMVQSAPINKNEHVLIVNGTQKKISKKSAYLLDMLTSD